MKWSRGGRKSFTRCRRSVGGGFRATRGSTPERWPSSASCSIGATREARRRNQPARRVLRDDLIVEIARRGSADVKHIQAVRGMERGDLQRRMGELAAAVQRALDLPDAECPDAPFARARAGAFRPGPIPLRRAGQHLARGPARPESGRHSQRHPRVDGLSLDEEPRTHDNPPQLARGWRAEFVGRLFEDLLDGKLSIRIDDPTSDHPLAFERQ